VEGGVQFRLWAPSARQVELVIDGRRLPMPRDDAGFAERTVAGAGPGTRYAFRVDGEIDVPDPASRFQPDGVHGTSEVVDLGALPFARGAWRGRPWSEAVIYELHVGAFSPEGTFDGVARRLDH